MTACDNGIADTAPNLDVLEGMLSALRDLAKSDYPALVLVMSEAVKICESRHAVRAGFNMELQAALASIRTGRPNDAERYIEMALDIEEHWVGGVTQGFESPTELPRLANTVNANAGAQSPLLSVLRLIAATLLVLPVAVFTLVAAAVVRALMEARRLFAYLHNRSTALFEALLREMGLSL